MTTTGTRTFSYSWPWSERPASVDAAFPTRVHVDFNDLEADGTVIVLQAHTEPGRSLRVGDPVLLQDCEGNSMHGHVATVGTYATVRAVPDSWCSWSDR